MKQKLRNLSAQANIIFAILAVLFSLHPCSGAESSGTDSGHGKDG